MGKRGEGAAEGDKVSSRPLLLFTDSSQPTAHYRSSCSLPLCYGTLASLFYFSLFFPLLQFATIHIYPTRRATSPQEAKNQEPREEPKQSKPKGTRSVTCCYPPPSLCPIQYTSHSTPKAHFSSYPTSTPLLPSLEHRPHPHPHTITNHQGQTSKGE